MTYSHHDFHNLSPVDAARARETALANGLRHLAASFGKEFKEPLQIDSNGEIDLIISDPLNQWSTSCGRYGDALAKVLSPHGPRTGIVPASSIDGLNGWCRMNHFGVAAMLEQFESTERTFRCKFFGKKSGALGVAYWINDVEVFSVSTFEKIRLAVYKAGYEAVSELAYIIVEKS